MLSASVMSRSLSWKMRTSSSPRPVSFQPSRYSPSFEELEHAIELTGERAGVALDLALELVDVALHPSARRAARRWVSRSGQSVHGMVARPELAILASGPFSCRGRGGVGRAVGSIGRSRGAGRPCCAGRKASATRPDPRRPADRRTRPAPRFVTPRAGVSTRNRSAPALRCATDNTAAAPADLPPEQPDHVTGFQSLEGGTDVASGATPMIPTHQFVRPAAVLVDVAAVAMRRVAQFGQLGRRLVRRVFEPHHAAVGLVLREERLASIASSGGYRRTRFAAMLYVGRNDA